MELKFSKNNYDLIKKELYFDDLRTKSNLSKASTIKLDIYALEVLNEFDLNELNDISEEVITEKVTQYRNKFLSSISYKNSIFQINPIKKLVSKKKIRFEFEGFDLDLTYITDRIIAMGYPADNIEKIYRNPLEEVKCFFEKRHNNRYKIYNLCSERIYPLHTFQAQGYYPFDDHEAPPIDMILPFCEDIHQWLSFHPSNVIAIHCKAGKGRTGLMICCFLIYSNFLSSDEQALKFFGLMRTSNGKGVTIKSQMRYIKFFEEIVKRKIPYPLNSPELKLKKIIFNKVPNYNLMTKGCTPYFKIFNDNFNYSYKEDNNLIDYSLEDKIEFNLNNIFLKGDFKIIFYYYRVIGSGKMFKFWYNTYFIPGDGTLILKKKDLDIKLPNGEKCRLGDDFKIQIIFDMENSHNDNLNKIDDNNIRKEEFYFFQDIGDIKHDFNIYNI